MMPNPIHYVPLEGVVMRPPRLLAVCGRWCDGADWSTSSSIVSCPECQVFIVVTARMERRPVTSPAASLVDAAQEP